MGPKRKGESEKMGSLRIPQREGLPEPAYQFPSDVVFLMNRWYDPFFSYNHEYISEIFKHLESYMRGEQEKRQFKEDYTEFQRIKTSKSFFNSIEDILDLASPLNPKIIVFYKLLFGNYEKNNGAALSRVYTDITKNSVYSRMPELLGISETLGRTPKIVLTLSEENSAGNSHILSAESMTVKKVKAEYPDISVISPRDIPHVAYHVNELLKS